MTSTLSDPDTLLLDDVLFDSQHELVTNWKDYYTSRRYVESLLNTIITLRTGIHDHPVYCY